MSQAKGRVQGKVCIITGAASGMGHDDARAFGFPNSPRL